MQNPSYLIQSRHGIYYFRYPLPFNPSNRISISLGTRTPKIALWTVILFAIVSHTIWVSIIYNWSTFTDPAKSISMALISLIVGVTIHIWLQWRKNHAKSTDKIVKYSTYAIALLLVIILTVNAIGIYLLASQDNKSSLISEDMSHRNNLSNLASTDNTDSKVVRIRTSSNGDKYIMTCNEDGYILSPRHSTKKLTSVDAAINLKSSCVAHSKDLGSGSWCWANGGFLIEFINSKIGFPRQELYCKDYDRLSEQCGC